MESSLKKLEEIIFAASTKKLVIPKFQRPYKWEEQQIDEFWEDIKNENTSLFIGPIIVNTQFVNSNEEPRLEVVDGQQRLISATILAAVIRDLFKEMGERSLAAKIQDRYVAFVDDNDNDLGFRLTTGQSTRPYFEKYIQSEGNDIHSSETDTKEHQRIKKNYLFLKEKAKNELINTSTNERKKDYLASIRDNLKALKVIEIRINDDNEAYEIFERINNYGIDLSLSDLLKNHVLKNTSSSDNAYNIWYELETNMKEADIELKKFIRYHWLSKYVFKTEKQLYNDIKSTITNYDSFLEEISDAGETYVKLLTSHSKSDFEDLEVNDKKIGSYIYSISVASRYMSVSQDKVLYLAIVRLCREGRLLVNPKKILAFLEAFLFKYFAVCKQPANKVERLFSNYAVQLEKECSSDNTDKQKTQNTDRIFSRLKTDLKDLLPSRELFIEKFQNIKYTNSVKSRMFLKYILDKYETYLSSSETMLNFENVNIEHFLPQKPENWGLTIQEIKDYVNNLGNLVMVDYKLNGKMGNKSLNDKIKILGESELKMNSKLLEKVSENGNSWNQEAIELRNKEIAEIAFDCIWKSD